MPRVTGSYPPTRVVTEGPPCSRETTGNARGTGRPRCRPAALPGQLRTPAAVTTVLGSVLAFSVLAVTHER